MPPSKKAKAGRPPTNRVAKPASKTSTSKRISAARIAAVAEAIGDGRAASGKKQSGGAAEPSGKGQGRGRGRKRAAHAEQDEAEEEDDTVMTDPPAPAIQTPPAAKQKRARGRPKKAALEAEAALQGQPSPRARLGRRLAVSKADPETTAEDASEIPETQQPEAAQGDAGNELAGLEDLPTIESPDRANGGRGHVPVPNSASRPSLHPSSPEKGADPALRRRLGEMTQKYETLERRYRDLKEIAVKEAERNFDKLKKQSEEQSKAADQLIATLKAELAAQKEASKEIQRLTKQLEASESKADSLQHKVTELTSSLSESRSEIRSLNLKLTAARNAEAAAAAASSKVPGSAIKGSTAASRLAAANASEAIQQATLAAQKKENLYGDLTGLIVRSVKREEGEDIFDCIQTGRNGTLHFKLAIDVDPDGGGGASNGTGEAHCHYTPKLDPGRDRALIAILPGYLADEISFPQAQAGKFYARVLKALNEQPESS